MNNSKVFSIVKCCFFNNITCQNVQLFTYSIFLITDDPQELLSLQRQLIRKDRQLNVSAIGEDGGGGGGGSDDDDDDDENVPSTSGAVPMPTSSTPKTRKKKGKEAPQVFCRGASAGTTSTAIRRDNDYDIDSGEDDARSDASIRQTIPSTTNTSLVKSSLRCTDGQHRLKTLH
ncbi:uncharacterized protein LOC117117756 [Anneissia japonica]|uniref:uncharacterized protein LOC117117756 n=1 Tax=Anneissia japonica TaxID=1529436 RepID=UPI001425B291|nr:uncharacterized protein LOC117117756 [Anneissia japonica]